MKLLIIEDNDSLRAMLVNWAQCEISHAALEVEVLTAANLVEALELCPQADAVLCDGTFPTEPSGIPEANWLNVATAAYRQSATFVLLSGSLVMVALARGHGYMAFEKPLGTSEAIRTLLGALSLKAAEKQVSGAEGQVTEENPIVTEMDLANHQSPDDSITQSQEGETYGNRKRVA